jgi:hypothetical protein
MMWADRNSQSPQQPFENNLAEFDFYTILQDKDLNLNCVCRTTKHKFKGTFELGIN